MAQEELEWIIKFEPEQLQETNRSEISRQCLDDILKEKFKV